MTFKKKLSRLRRLFQKKSVVLCYHRIATPEVDSWELCVSPENFEAQLKELSELNIAVSVNDMVENLQNRQIRNNVVVTFDDGYIDNFKIAAPLLAKYNIPATFFITSRNIGQQKEFWWDELEAIILLQKELPQLFSLQIEDEKVEYDLMQEKFLVDEILNKHKLFSAYNAPPTQRAKLYFDIWSKLFPLEQKQQEDIMSDVRAWAGVSESLRPEYLCMSADEIRLLALNPLFTIGGHTHSHLSLRHLPKQKQSGEITDNCNYLNSITGKKVEYLAYPSGSFNNDTIDVVKGHVLMAAFTTQQKAVYNNSDQYKISRFQALNCNSETFKMKLQNWLRY